MLNPAQEKMPESFKSADGASLETVEKVDLVEWLAAHFKEFGCALEFITDRSQEGAQFVRGFGGIGGTLRWQADFEEYEEFVEDVDGAKFSTKIAFRTCRGVVGVLRSHSVMSLWPEN